MTDISTHQQSVAFTSSRARRMRLPVTLLKYLFRSRRTSQIDLRYANDHFLKDIGLTRSHDVPPYPPHGKLW